MSESCVLGTNKHERPAVAESELKKLSWSGDLSSPASPSQSSVGEVIQCIEKRHLQSGLQAILHNRKAPIE
jgi:hypothetical protein